MDKCISVMCFFYKKYFYKIYVGTILEVSTNLIKYKYENNFAELLK